MLKNVQTVKKVIPRLMILLPFFSFLIPIGILYSLYSYTFEQTYHGRTLYFFFLWVFILEIILSWEKFQKSKMNKLKSLRTVSFIIALLLPTLYVIIANYYGLNAVIADLAIQHIPPDDPLRSQHASLIALSTEYMVFAVLFCLIILIAYGTNTLTDVSISAFFLGTIGVLFTIDNLFPYGRFTPLQILVPTTATLAAGVLNLMGYEVIYGISSSSLYGSMPYLTIKDFPWASFGIAWPCSGIESLLIYTLTILLFLKKMTIPWKHKIVYFAIGAVVIYFINILRIVTLFLIAINKGPSFNILDYDFQRFHNYYGMLYSMTWIMLYPLIIIGSQTLWRKIRNSRTASKGNFELLKVTPK